MTERLYYTDPYLRAFSARVVERTTLNDQPALVLDRTAFYPTGGGQPHDTGTLNGIPVIDVQARKPDHVVLHVVEHLPDADELTAEIDWTRRFDHMQQHTGQHILTQAFVQSADAHTVGFHLSADSVTIDLDRADLTDAQVAAAEALANRIVMENRPVIARLIHPNDADALASVRLRKLPEGVGAEGLRVVDVSGFDQTACGGTHVAHTGEIGMIKVIRLEKRGDKTRVEFACGARALHDYREKNAVINRVTPLLNCGYWEIDQSISRLQDQLRQAQRQLRALSAQLIDYQTADLLARAAPTGDARLIVHLIADDDLEQARALAKALTAHPGVVALLGVPGERAQLVFARSADLPYDLNPALKAALPLLGEARGGGKPDFVQGGGVPADRQRVSVALDAARAALSLDPDQTG